MYCQVLGVSFKHIKLIINKRFACLYSVVIMDMTALSQYMLPMLGDIYCLCAVEMMRCLYRI